MADTFKVLGDPTRLKILALLKQRDFCVCELVSVFDISQPAISRHLSRLKAAELVSERRKGQWVFYSLDMNREQIDQISKVLIDALPDVSEELERLTELNVATTCE